MASLPAPALARTASPFKLPARGWAVLILLFAFALRVHALGAKSLWYDELRQVEVAQQPWSGFVPGLRLHAARPLDYLVTRALLAGGQQEFWLRAPALLWSTLTVAALYALGRRWQGARPALWAMALLAASPMAVQYAQEQRPYALYLLLAVLGVWALDRALAAPGRAGPWLALAAAAAAGALTHFFYAVVLGVQLAYGLAALGWRPRLAGRRSAVAGLAGAALAGVLALQVAARPEHLRLFAGQFLGALGGATTGAGLVSDTGVTVRVSEAINADFFLKGLLPAFGAGPSALALLLFNGLALLGLLALAAHDRRRFTLLLLWLMAAPVVVIVYLQYRQQFFALRYIIFALPAYLLLAAAGLEKASAGRRAVTGVLLVALLGLSLAQVRADYRQPKDDWRRVGAFLAANARPGDTLGAPDVQAFIRFYAPGQPAAIVDANDRGPHEQALANGERFWFVWSDYTLIPIPDTRAWANGLTGVSFHLDPRIRVIFVHPGRTQAEMLAEAEGFAVPPPSLK